MLEWTVVVQSIIFIRLCLLCAFITFCFFHVNVRGDGDPMDWDGKNLLRGWVGMGMKCHGDGWGRQ